GLRDRAGKHVHEAIVKLELTDGDFVHPCLVTTRSTAAPDTHNCLLGKFLRSDLIRKLSRNGHARCSSVEQQRGCGAVVEADAQAVAAWREISTERQRLQFQLSAGHVRSQDPHLTSGQRLQKLQVIAFVSFDFRIGTEFRKMFLQRGYVGGIRLANGPFIERVAVAGIKLMRPCNGLAGALVACQRGIYLSLPQECAGALAVNLESGLVLVLRVRHHPAAEINVAPRVACARADRGKVSRALREPSSARLTSSSFRKLCTRPA